MDGGFSYSAFPLSDEISLLSRMRGSNKLCVVGSVASSVVISLRIICSISVRNFLVNQINQRMFVLKYVKLLWL